MCIDQNLISKKLVNEGVAKDVLKVIFCPDNTAH